ncbi:MAG: multidrug efflux RND transporter permease subunit [Rhodospirillaceae bacterium]|nr:multidrug efflux RND transporter permease subunit [Rhodospirillaceae bacterium]
MRFTDIFIRRPVLAMVVSLLILLAGLRALYDLPIRQYPVLTNTVITVTTTYPGAPASLMQGFITTPIEQAISTAEGIDYLTSSSQQGKSTVTAYIRLNFDPNVAMTDIMAKVNQVRYLIPRDANDPVVLKSTGETTGLMYIGFSSSEVPAPAVADYVKRVVQPILSTVEGVASAQILGGQTFAMRIWLDPTRMAARGITASDVADAIRANNYQAAPGQSKGYFVVTNIVADTDLTSIDEFREMVVKAGKDSLVRLKDVATVELGAQSADSSVEMNGEHAVFVEIQQAPIGNPLTITRDIRALMPSIQANLPPSFKVQIAYDASSFIRASIYEVVKTLGEALAIVVVVIFLFLGTVRSVLIPVVTIPLALIGAAIFMLALGFSLNLLTLLAMVLAIGLVVDDAIVVVENVYRHIEEGSTPVQAALRGAREIAAPVVAMTLTLAAVYAPIGFQGGLTGALFLEFAFTLAGAVIISGITALTLSPMMSSYLLTRAMMQGRFTHFVDQTFARLAGWYSRRLRSALDHRWSTLLIGVAMLLGIFFFYTNSRHELAPEEDQGVIFGLVKGPQYANLDYMEAYTHRIEQAYASFPESALRFIVNGFNGPNQGFAGTALKPWQERMRSQQEIAALAQAKMNEIEGLQIFLFAPPSLPGSTGGLPVQMVISAVSDYQTIFNVMEQLKAAAFQSGLFMVVDSDLQFNNPTARVKIDRSKANDLGITMQSIGDTLTVLLGGNFINRFNLNGYAYDVIPQVPRALRLTPGDLDDYYVATRSGAQVPLSTVVSVETEVQPNALPKYNQLASATFSAVPMPGVTMGQAVDFLEERAAELLPAGFRHAYLSQSRQYVTEGNQLLVTLVFALIAIFLVLAAQFESLRDPLIILVSVPMSICGALVFLYFGAATINIYTQVGLVTLVGLISKHGILMVSFANQIQAHEGLDRRGAIERAARVRLRPILMTTAAMVAGAIPLVTAAGAGAASRFSMGLVIITGMTIGTMFTLFVLPAVYTLLARDHRAVATSARAVELEAAAGR